ncbi:hypothetical protein G5C51_40265 [Streptomyces sp. A7024]|uniref:Secreted protein n=1 Tax=Streptomyces coryli TaxID=1128680 RepID=A0A6G4UEA1_9ACTN|nr:hypothetical protein [Streptomyces coryli]NGN70110.1 hypothetical protein [Streptomyces coryli]
MTKKMTNKMRSTAAAAALLAGLATAASPAASAAEQPDAPPGFSFAACPTPEELPADADPGTWRCEAMKATGRLKVGGINEAIDRPMTITFAEGRVDGEFAQVFGEMEAAPIRIGGSPWTITPRYAGYSDFESNDERRGELDLKFTLAGPGLPTGCSIGSDAAAVHLVLTDTEPTQVISPDPLIVAFGAEDTRFTAPRTSGCGRLGPVLDRVLELPSAAGQNSLDLDAQVAIRQYDAP